MPLNMFNNVWRLAVVSIFLVALTGARGGCMDNEPVPSYAGTYELVESNYEGYGVADGKPTEIFPAVVTVPTKLEIYQTPFNRTNAHNDHYLVSLVDTVAGSGKLFGAHFDGGGVVTEQLFKTAWEDNESPLVSFDEGYACKFETGARMTLTLTPDTPALDKAYPVCEIEQTSSGSVCVQPQEWSDLPVDEARWLGVAPEMEVEFEVYRKKRVDDPGCAKQSLSSRAIAKYKRSSAREMGDLRVRDNPETLGILKAALGGKEEVMRKVFLVDGSRYMTLFQD